ncbi:MAG: trypsin-like serine protease, partial [Bdellovibrionales bacterium]|nr:trypsin-like serine protease [Bdellovibrionales bacterium]
VGPFASFSLAKNDDCMARSSGAFGAVVRVPIYDKGILVNQCSGVLIAPKIVLSARHCLIAGELKNVILGTGHRFENIEIQSFKTLEKKSIQNTQLNSDGSLREESVKNLQEFIRHDLLVIFLKKASQQKPFQILPSEAWVALEKQNVFYVGYPEGNPYWEKTNWDQKVQVPVTARGDCHLDDFLVQESLLKSDCLAGPGQSGGPLFTEWQGQFYLIGIHSSGSQLQIYVPDDRNRGLAVSINLLNKEIKKFIDSLF